MRRTLVMIVAGAMAAPSLTGCLGFDDDYTEPPVAAYQPRWSPPAASPPPPYVPPPPGARVVRPATAPSPSPAPVEEDRQPWCLQSFGKGMLCFTGAMLALGLLTGSGDSDDAPSSESQSRSERGGGSSSDIDAMRDALERRSAERSGSPGWTLPDTEMSRESGWSVQ